MAGKTDGLRKRASADGSKSNGEKQNTKELERTKSWSEKATDHVTSRRRYSILFGALLGVVGVFMTQIHYFDDNFPDFLDHQTIQQLRHQWNFDNWSTSIRDEFFDAIDYRPSSAPEDGVRPGVKLRGEGLGAHSPVILLPGFSSTGLEIWNGSECVQTYFRQRIWGTSRMVQQFLMNQRCWLEHLMLNRTTGMDPDGIKLRPAEGLEAADYVIGGYWVWAKLIENLADIGYDSNSMYMAAYDWRMAPAQMEERDQYFTKLRYTIEMARASSGGKKVMIVAHSYALQVFYFFMQWVQSPKGGNMGSSWMDENVESFVNIAGPTLGTIKSISTLMSGEMKDTAELGGLSKVLGFFFGPKSRALLARSWPSVYAMLPVGGDTIWGDGEFAADDLVSRFAVPAEGSSATYNKSQIPEHVHRHGSNGKVVQFTNNTHANFTAGNVHGFLGSVDKNLEHFRQNFSVGIADDPSDDKYDDSKYWANPLETRLPYAPQMKIFCLYGVGKPVERGYIYRENPGEDDVVGDKDVVPYVMDLDYTDAPWIKAGVRYSDGDGTVPLISLGYMCSHGWRSKRYNPSGMEVRSREYVHDPLPMMFDPRGGPATSDHVDIMGNHNLISDLLRIAAREYDSVPERVKSEIHELVKRVPLELD